jgi:hypothetical protein
MNWTGVTFTPLNGAPITITGVTSIQIDSGGIIAKFSGDGDRFSTTVVNDYNDPTVSIHSADLAAVTAFPIGTVGTFTATHNDSRNGAGSGAMTYTLANAVIASQPIHGSHRQFGEGSLTLSAFSLDGVTNPLSISMSS